MNDPEKKIIIDEDWKTQIEREKEELAAQQTDQSESAAAAADIGPEPDLPPASFAFIVSTMVAQSMAAMGQLPDPVSGKPEIRLKFAKHQIDTLAVLQEKTQGNLSSEESQLLEDSLHQLRMMYVQLESQLA